MDSDSPLFFFGRLLRLNLDFYIFVQTFHKFCHGNEF